MIARIDVVAEELVSAFGEVLNVATPKEHRFGRVSASHMGVSDGAKGVQWSTYVEGRENTAYVTVNLEGMTYDGWPIARFIEREFRHPRLFEIAARFPDLASIQVIVRRDAWRFASRPPIKEAHIGHSRRTVGELDPASWQATLREAYDCLDATEGHRRRGRQNVTLASGVAELSVSPHLQFRQRIAERADQERAWAPLIAAAKRTLTPLHEFVSDQSRS